MPNADAKERATRGVMAGRYGVRSLILEPKPVHSTGTTAATYSKNQAIRQRPVVKPLLRPLSGRENAIRSTISYATATHKNT